MAIAIMVEIPGVTAQQYDALLNEVWPGGHPPRECAFHVAGPAEGVWRVIDVWDARASFDRFVQSTLGPAMQRAGVTEQPRIQEWPVHNMAHSH